MADEIDIKGIDKAMLLAGLYNGSRPLGLGFLQATLNDMTVEEARAEIKERNGDLYFDYLNDRVMKVDISGDTLGSWGYDRDLGQGAAQSVVSAIREGKTTPKNASDFGSELDAVIGSAKPSTMQGNVMELGIDGELLRALESKRPVFKREAKGDQNKNDKI